MKSSNRPIQENEGQKMASMARMFLIKVAEAIYSVRCPGEITDFVNDDESWFSVKSKKSSQLRQVLSSKNMHGWFKIDVILTNPDTILERWYMIQLPPSKTDQPVMKPESRSEAYRHFSQIYRSIISLLHSLPCFFLNNQLSRVSLNNRKIFAICDPFKPLPAHNDPFSELETGQIRFGPVMFPAGRVIVFCHHLIDLHHEIPRPIRTAEHYDTDLPLSIPKPQVQPIPSFGKSYETALSFQSSEMCLTSPSFSMSPEKMNSVQQHQEIKKVEEFIRDLNSALEMKICNSSLSIRERFDAVSKEINQLLK